MLQFVDVKKSFGQKVILDGVSLSATQGEILYVIGTSGVGKSVLIKQVVGLIQPDSGHIFLDGQEISYLSEQQYFPIRKQCALVFQHATLFDAMTCLDNVVLPLRKHADPSAGTFLNPRQAKARALELLDQVEMADFASKYPSTLGDGLRKRVAVARALALRPKYVLLDEPTTGLDPVNARRIDLLIADLAKQHGVTCIVVSHDLRSIFTIAHRIAMLYKGKVNALGTPDELKRSTDPIVNQFIRGLSDGPLETT